MARPILGRSKIEIFWMIFLVEVNILKAVVLLSLAIMKMKSHCFENQLFEPIYFAVFGLKCLHFMIKVKNFEGLMASVAKP